MTSGQATGLAAGLSPPPVEAGRPFTASPAVDEVFAALVSLQPELQSVAADKENSHFKAKYASLGAYLDMLRPILSTHELAVFQTTRDHEERITVVTTLAHSSGQWISGEMTLRPTKNDPQGFGSAITYMRRYGLTCLLGLSQSDDDDDGAKASKEVIETLTETQLVDLAAKAEELFGDDADDMLSAMAEKVFRVDGWHSIQSKHFSVALNKLEAKAKAA